MGRFKFTNHLDYPEMDSHTAENGKRQYFTPCGAVSSVTTILSSLPHPELDAWKERVGEEEAKRISKEATTIGSFMHDHLENYVLDKPLPDPTMAEHRMAIRMFQPVKLMGLKHVRKIWGVEVPLYFHNLYAGRTDLVGEYRGKPAVIDYKTSKFLKKAEYLEDYKTQVAMYSLAHDWMFPEERIEMGVLLVGLRPSDEFRKPPQCQIITIDSDELEHYKFRAVQVVHDFYAAQDMLDEKAEGLELAFQQLGV